MSRLVLGTAPTKHVPVRRILRFSFVVFVLVLVIVRLFFLQLALVQGNTMAPLLVDGDLVMIRQRGKPQLGDVVVVEQAGRAVWRRVLGLPGDVMGTKNGVLTLNGVALETRAIGSFGYYEGKDRQERRQKRLREALPDGSAHSILGDYQGALNPWFLELDEIEVPPGYYFVFCDNRPTCAQDELSGLVPASAVNGIANRILWQGSNRITAEQSSNHVIDQNVREGQSSTR